MTSPDGHRSGHRHEHDPDLDRQLDQQMVTALVRLRQALVDAELPFELDGVDGPGGHRATRGEMVDQLEDYLIPRLMTTEAPLVVVVGGSTGAGKSTLVNSLVGHRVTAPGVLRPTTRSPVLVHHPDDAHWFGQDRLLPDLTRVDHSTDDPDSLQLVATDAVPPGLAVLDAPDVDSVEERNRLLAAQLLAAGDLWLFVTSAARYSDQVPWHYLKQAAERSTAVAVVLDRTPEEAVQTVATHLARMLASRGLRDCPLFTVAEGSVDEQGLLPASYVKEIRVWLESLADDADARGVVVRQTLDGAVRALSRRVYPLADAVAEQRAVALRLADEADRAFDGAATAVDDALGDGSLVRGELLARWDDFVGSGDLVRSLDTRVSGLRERLVNTIKGKPQQGERVTVAVATAVEALLLQQAEAAATAVTSAWQRSEAGAALMAGARPGSVDDLTHVSRELRRRSAAAVHDWQAEVVEMVRAAGADKRTTARFLAYGVNGLAVALTVVSFGAGPADGPAATPHRLGRRLLEAVFGPDDLAALLERAHRSLIQRATGLLHDERTRYGARIDGLALKPDVAEELRTAARRVDDLRYAAARNDPPAAEDHQ